MVYNVLELAAPNDAGYAVYEAAVGRGIRRIGVATRGNPPREGAALRE